MYEDAKKTQSERQNDKLDALDEHPDEDDAGGASGTDGGTKKEAGATGAAGDVSDDDADLSDDADDNSLGLNFTTTTFYDGQGFMVAKDLGIESLEDLNGASICIQSGTTHELNLADYFPSKGIDIDTVTFDTPDQTAQGFASGRCDVLTSDTSQLSALRLQLPEPDSVEILTELISKEPLGPVVRQGDDQWLDIVKWSVFAMVNAEELGVTRDNVDEMQQNPPNPQVARLLGDDGNYGEQMGLENDWAYDIIAQALSGMMAATGPDGGMPTRIGESLGDVCAGMFASWSIAAALFARERDPERQGCHLDVSMLDCLFSMQVTNLAQFVASGQAPPPIGNRHPLSAPFDSFEANDGQVIIAVISA